MIDVYYNILPGFSKGPASMEEAVLMARLAEREGITTVIARQCIIQISQYRKKRLLISQKN